MKTVIKIGGSWLDDPSKVIDTVRRTLNSPTVIVHGGGIQITRMLERLNGSSTFVDGLRVTDETTLHAVRLGLLGEVHSALVQTLQAAGLPVVGAFGAIRAVRKEGPWGFVGARVEADPEMLGSLLSIRRIPVVPTLAIGAASSLNVNGDETAAAVAAAVRANRLIFMTDVAGVKNQEGSVINHVADVDQLLAASYVSGGMLPKLRAVKSALNAGVRLVQVGSTVFEAAS
jgi:acetylglutamate kinase